MPGNAAAGSDRLSIIVFSGDFARVHYALVLAAAAAASGTKATLFFTMEACRFLARPDSGGRAAWRSLPAGLAFADAGRADDAYAERGVATFEELLAAAVEMGVRFIACEMGLRVLGLEAGGLRDDVPLEIAGVVTFLADTSPNGVSLFV